jgi:hypothetical protein
MALLPTFIFSESVLSRLQTQWKAILDPVIANPTTNPTLLKNIVLKTGVNTINHNLQAIQQGWVVTDINAAITLYRSAPYNDLTLTLVASAPATISLLVY